MPSSGVARRAITQDDVAVPNVIDIRPSLLEMRQLELRVESAGLAHKKISEILHWAEIGSYSAALDVLLAMVEEAPRNLTLRRLHDDVRGGALVILEDRLGSKSRKVVLRPGPHGAVGKSYQAILALAAREATLGEIERSCGPDTVRTLERVSHLLRRGHVMLRFVS